MAHFHSCNVVSISPPASTIDLDAMNRAPILVVVEV